MNSMLKRGIIGGIIAGIIFAVAEMLGAKFISGNPLLMPLKSIASIPLGTKPPAIATSTAIPVGLITHLILSIAFGLVFALIATGVDALRSSPTTLVVTASIYGTILWLLNFYVIAPALGRPWFTETPAVQQFVYHTIFFGAAFGLFLVATMPEIRGRTQQQAARQPDHA